MYCLVLLSCVLFVNVCGNVVPKEDEDLPELKWPTKYTLAAEKISLTTGLVENIKYWRSENKSRLDYNKGAVKMLNVKSTLNIKYPFGIKYKVHAETTEEKENYFVCKKTRGSFTSIINVEDILPDEDTFEHVESKRLEQETMEKFYYSEEYRDSDIRRTLWAVYDRQKKIWIPNRLEEVEFDRWLEFKEKHDIWNFYNYKTLFNSSVIFDFESLYDCQDSKENDDERINSQSNSSGPDSHHEVDRIFNIFKKKHAKNYADKKEHTLRKNLFKKRMRLVLENNKKNTGYKLAINKFADRTPEEMKRYMGLVRPSQRQPDTHPFPYSKMEFKKLASELPTEFDLRDLGLVTPAKAQEDCGSCWTFTTSSAVEGAIARRNGGRLIRLSNQALIDCSWGFGTSGCNGGYDTAAYNWMIKYGLPTEAEYGPYVDKEGFCHIHNMTELYPIRGYTYVTPYSVEALKVALVNHGPLSVSIHATEALQAYNSGIFYDVECDPTTINHMVTLIGYGQRNGEEFWIAKNSWGQRWGIDGYFHISVRDNSCGIATEPSYPVV